MLIIKYVIAQRYARLNCNFGLQRYKKIMTYANFYVIFCTNLVFCYLTSCPVPRWFNSRRYSAELSFP